MLQLIGRLMPQTIRQFLIDPRGQKQYCAFCQYFTPEVDGKIDSTGYGSCNVPDSLVVVPNSYRAENEGTAAYYGVGCTFFIQITAAQELPSSWKWLDNLSPLKYE